MRQHRIAKIVTLALACVLAAAWAPLRAQDLAADAELVETRTEVPKLKAAAAYQPKDNVVEVELSEYAGYAGLIAANNGTDPNEDSYFFKNHKIKLKITLSEEESWSALNSGRIGVSATTADVLAVYGRQFEVVTPALIGFSRGADGVVVRANIKRINDLAGKVVATCQFTESDFFIRYLAQEAGLGINMLPDLKAKPDPAKLNLVYCGDGFGAGDLFLRDVKAGRNRVAGCVTWAPKTTEVAQESAGKAIILVTNRNLLIVADVLVVNKGFAQAHPEMVRGLVDGMLYGNNLVRGEPDKHLPLIAKAFKWEPEEAKAEVAKVHLANLPENQAFFNGTIDSAGSFGFIYETAGYVYGRELLGKIADGDRFVDAAHLKAIADGGKYKDQKAAIQPLKGGGKAERGADEALLSKDIRFFFDPNSAKLTAANAENTKGLGNITQLLKVSPGSTILLRGHADGSLLEKFRQEGGEAKVREARLTLKNLSKARCAEVKQMIQEKFSLDPARIEAQGVGADEPTGKGPDADRRVEVQWFTVE